MNGLDLTSWIEKASTVEMIQTVCVVAALISKVWMTSQHAPPFPRTPT